ncbi:hypothetical protein Ndes2526B_g06657 [Nannochloris sp. 'desiccata']|nr:hypothetical protein KSW81_008381 [Chlorella desiccata (nom. nud.)]KAH7619677.1 hypothetical protein NADE_006508 [Chlorella desiccata (nom. nud.)]
MRVSFIALVLAVAYIAQPSFAAITTVGDLVDGICPDAKLRLGQNALLSTALTLAASTEIEVPDSGTPILFAPSDAALTAALPKLGVSVAELAFNPQLIKDILSLHLANAESTAISTATTINGKTVNFQISGAESPINDFVATTDNTARSVTQGATIAKTEDIVACIDGPIAVFTDTVFLPDAAAPAPGPDPAPAPTPTIGGLVGAACQGIKDVLAAENFSILAGLLTDPEIAATEITLPEGVVVIAAPTNAAFETLIAAVGPAAAANKTILTEILANHIATAAKASDTTATALSGETMGFWTEMGGVGGNMAPVPTGIAAIAASKTGIISDTPVDELAKVLGAITCTAEGQYAFGIDTVLVPEKYTPKPAPAPTPGPAPDPQPTPAPQPTPDPQPTPASVPPSGSAGVASVGFAAVAAVAAAMLI